QAGAVDITVTTVAGTSATGGGDQFTYNATVPGVGGVTPASGPTSGGTIVTITGTNFTGATGGFFDLTFSALSFTVYSDTTIIAIAPPHGAGTVHITVTTYGGTSAQVPLDQFTYSGGGGGAGGWGGGGGDGWGGNGAEGPSHGRALRLYSLT